MLPTFKELESAGFIERKEIGGVFLETNKIIIRVVVNGGNIPSFINFYPLGTTDFYNPFFTNNIRSKKDIVDVCKTFGSKIDFREFNYVMKIVFGTGECPGKIHNGEKIGYLYINNKGEMNDYYYNLRARELPSFELNDFLNSSPREIEKSKLSLVVVTKKDAEKLEKHTIDSPFINLKAEPINLPLNYTKDFKDFFIDKIERKKKAK